MFRPVTIDWQSEQSFFNHKNAEFSVHKQEHKSHPLKLYTVVLNVHTVDSQATIKLTFQITAVVINCETTQIFAQEELEHTSKTSQQ